METMETTQNESTLESYHAGGGYEAAVSEPSGQSGGSTKFLRLHDDLWHTISCQ
jgi:hypothetical protein